MNNEKRREPVRTTLTIELFVRAMVAAWRPAWRAITAEFVAMIWAKYIAETSNKHCYNWNLGNVKDVEGDGLDYHCLRGVWEGVPKSRADALIASGQARLDTNEEHRAAVAPLVAVVFEPPHAATRFRSYDSLEHAMSGHLAFLASRYPRAFEVAHAGNVPAFVQALSGYATASAGAYTRAMSPAYALAMKTVPGLLADALSTASVPEVVVDEPMPLIHGTHVVEATIRERCRRGTRRGPHDGLALVLPEEAVVDEDAREARRAEELEG